MVIHLALAESLRWQGLRKLAAAAIHEDLRRRRPPACSVDSHLLVDVLTVTLKLWWPWLLVPFSAPLLWLWARRRVHTGRAKLRIPMRVMRIRVGYRSKRPK